MLYGEPGSGKTDSICSVATAIYLSQIGSFVPADYLRHSVFSRIECLQENRMMANVDQISSFGADITRMSRSLSSALETEKSGLFIIDNWGLGTRVIKWRIFEFPKFIKF